MEEMPTARTKISDIALFIVSKTIDRYPNTRQHRRAAVPWLVAHRYSKIPIMQNIIAGTAVRTYVKSVISIT